MFCESFETYMVRDMIVIDVDAFCDLVIEFLLSLRVADSHEGDAGDRKSDSRLRLEDFIFVPDGEDNVVEVAGCRVRLRGDDLEHPRAILVDHREGQVGVLGVKVFFVELEFSVLVKFEEVAFDFLSPLDHGEVLGFFPGSVESHSVEELFDSFLF